MLFYLVLWTVVSAFITPKFKYGKGLNTLSQIIGGIIYSIFAAFRNVTNNHELDIYEYYHRFNKADCNLFRFFRISQCEPGYSFVAWIVKNTTNSFIVFLLLVHIFIYFSHALFLNEIVKNKRDAKENTQMLIVGDYYNTQPLIIHKYFLSAVLCLNLFSAFYIQRNIMSLCFSFFFLLSLKENKNFKAVLFAILSIMFHYSAMIILVSLAFILIIKKSSNITIRKLIVLECAAFAVMIVLMRFVEIFMSESNKYSYYKQEGAVALTTVAIALYVIILYFINYSKINRQYKHSQYFGIMLLTMLLIIPLQSRYSIMYRMYMFYLPIIAIMLAYLSECHKPILKATNNIVVILYFSYRCYAFFSNEIQYIGEPYELIKI